MIAQGMRPLPRIPRALSPIPLSIIVIVLTLIGWAALEHSPAATDATPVQAVAATAADFHSIVYSDPTPTTDAIYIRSMHADAQPHLVTTFPASGGLHAHGVASPAGNSLAILAAGADSTSADTATASLYVVSLPSGVRSQMNGTFAYLSRLVWSPDGRYIFATASQATGSDNADVVVTDTYSGMTSRAARFPGAFEAAPVGFSADGTRLFVVTVDTSGSTLWQEQDGKVTKVAVLSAGRTRDWSLSPDGARLAFVDVLGSGTPGLVGRTLILATGAVNTTAATADQLSPAWAPGSDVPVFGGPGGQLKLTSPGEAAAYPAPQAYSPDGTGLVATIYPSSDESGATTKLQAESPGSLEIVSPVQRIVLTDAPGAAFFGWVRDPD